MSSLRLKKASYGLVRSVLDAVGWKLIDLTQNGVLEHQAGHGVRQRVFVRAHPSLDGLDHALRDGDMLPRARNVHLNAIDSEGVCER
jgi:hypothetical protein